jgi:hypothetical protein
MLYLEIAGKGHRRVCKQVVTWFKDTYLPRHHISLTVLNRGLLREGVHGWCSATDRPSRPRDFLIEVHNRLGVDEYVHVLCHELWHMFQHVKGTLREKGAKQYWKGVDHSETEYEDQPWEIEARLMESLLYEDFLIYLDKSQNTQ